MIVELFVTIGVAYVTPALGSDRVIHVAVGRYGRAIPPGIGILQETNNALSFNMVRRFDASQLAQRRVDTHEVYRLVTDCTNPLSPPSAPVQRRLQRPRAKSKFLAVAQTGGESGQDVEAPFARFDELFSPSDQQRRERRSEQ